MATILAEKNFNRIPFDAIFKDRIFILLTVEAEVEYVEGKRTDKVIGMKYEVAEPMDFHKFKVKVKGQLEPIISNDELQALRQDQKRVLVEFIGGVDTLYRKTVNRGASYENPVIEDSFSAEDVKLVETY